MVWANSGIPGQNIVIHSSLSNNLHVEMHLMRSIAFSRKTREQKGKNSKKLSLYLIEEVLVWLLPLHLLSASKENILCFCNNKKEKEFLYFPHINWSSHHESSFRHWFIFPCPCLRRLFFWYVLFPCFSLPLWSLHSAFVYTTTHKDKICM